MFEAFFSLDVHRPDRSLGLLACTASTIQNKKKKKKQWVDIYSLTTLISLSILCNFDSPTNFHYDRIQIYRSPDYT